MTAQILDGKAASLHIQQQIARTIEQRKQQSLRPPALAVILVGDDAASHIYVNAKRKACEAVGITSVYHPLPTDVSQKTLLELIDQLSTDPSIDGILLQLPLPPQIDAKVVLDHIPAHKDVDGFHPYNLGLLVQRRPGLRPCTPYGIIKLLDYAGLRDFTGAHVVVVGASNHVGRPMGLEFLLKKCTVTISHRFTVDLKKHVMDADILVVAAGKRNVVDSNWIKPGAIVADVGIHRLEGGKLSGDLEFETAKERAGWITPVPGGVGPMTIAVLLQNTLYASESAQLPLTRRKNSVDLSHKGRG